MNNEEIVKTLNDLKLKVEQLEQENKKLKEYFNPPIRNSKNKFLFVKSYRNWYWWTNLIGWISTIIISVISLGFAINSIIYNTNIVDTLSILSVIAMILFSGFWLAYNYDPILKHKDKPLKWLKFKAILADCIFSIFIVEMYFVIGYLAYIILGLDFKIHNIRDFSSVIWLSMVVVFLQIVLFVSSMIYTQYQTKTKKLKDTNNFEQYVLHWNPTLVYSYFLDKLYFSNISMITDDYIFSIYDKEKINSNSNIARSYEEFFKFKNIFKWFAETAIAGLVAVLFGFSIMLFATIETWIKETSLIPEFIAFIWVYWICITMLLGCCLWFVNVNRFQLIKKDNEKDIINKYNSIVITMYDEYSKLVNIPEWQKVLFTGIIRKIMLYAPYYMTECEEVNISFVNKSDVYYAFKFKKQFHKLADKPILEVKVVQIQNN